MPRKYVRGRLLLHGLAPLTTLAGIVAGCVRPDVAQPERVPKGCIFMLPGIEGTCWQLRGMVKGLREAGVEQGFEPIEWGKHPFRQLHNLCAYEANLERAKDIAGRIAAYQRAHPDAPITLIGYSGGGGLAILTTEALSDGVNLERLILISAAISPRYDLSKTLARSRHGLINFYSPGDWLFLGLGTRVFGTIDRWNGPSAGRVGFQDEHGTVIQTPAVTQINWRPEWVELGHDGGHIGWLSSIWAREVLAGYVKK